MISGKSPGAGERPHWPVRPAPIAACLLGAVLACVGRWEPPAPVGRHRTAAVPAAGARIGAEACFACHASFDGHFATSEAHPDCESCHGPAEQHAYTARAADIRYPSSEDCATCHRIGGKTLLGWTTSPHARADVICSDCHDVHDREPWLLRRSGPVQTAILRHAGDATRLCASCHPEVVAQFDLPSHHPLAEGMLECSDCHDPHEGRRQALGARTQRCLSCHQEVAGPWIYQHPPVNEDCGYCHAPHGASADFLLQATQPAACISCHSLPLSGAVHQPFAFTTGCTDCHNSVHGSYADPHLRR